MNKNNSYEKDIVLKEGQIDLLNENNINQINPEKKLIKLYSKQEFEEYDNDPTNFMRKKRGRKKEKMNVGNNQTGIHGIFSEDNIKMKVRAHYHNFIVAFLNMKSKKILEEKNKFAKLNSKFTGNITIEYNQKLFEQKIKDIIIHVSDKYKDKDKNINILNYVMNNVDKNDEIIHLLNMNYKNMYLNYYLQSKKDLFKDETIDESFEYHIEKLEELYGNKYVLDYIKIAQNLISSFYKKKKRIRKKIKNILIKPNLPGLNNYNINNNCFNININTKNENLLDKFMISTSTQTNMINEDEDEDEINYLEIK